MRRAAVIFKKYGVHTLSHGQIVAMVYQLLSAGNAELAGGLHKPAQKFKPFTHAADESKGSCTLYFSSFMPEITGTFLAGAGRYQAGGLMLGNCLYKIIDSVSIPDVSHLPGKMTIKTLSPIVLSRCAENRKKEYILYPKNEKVWLDALARNLAKRVLAFYGKDAQVEIQAVTRGKAALVEYQQTKIPARHMTLKITGGPEVLEMAIYGGLGERTGSGFGMVWPV